MRQIDAERLENKLQKYCREHYDDDSFTSFMANVLMMRVIEIVKKEPTITVDGPRPKGRWLERYGVSEYKYECSVCKMGSDLMTDFCPNCGAIMDEEVTHENR